MKLFVCLILTLASLGLAEKEVANKQRAKSFSIFSVVQFANSQCTVVGTTSGATPMQGTCFTTSECTSNGGTASGSCASGFGVCCMITVSTCGSTISKNVTYIQNPGFPSGFTTAGSCSYTVSSTSDICQLRLDFDTLVLGPPSTAAGAIGQCLTTDRLTISSPSGSGPNASPPVVCGTLSGQHMYVETGRISSGGTALAIANIGGAALTPARSWKIKVTRIECGSNSLAPTDCLQYFTGPGGTFRSFNYQAGAGQFIGNLNYHICFRQEEGFCTIQYAENDVSTAAAPAYKLGADAVTKRTGCAAVQLQIPGSAQVDGSEIYCGGVFSNTIGQTVPSVVTASAIPFQVGVLSVGGADLTMQVGFNLMYSQVPC